jgi:uracil-DNA glycosylase
MDPLKYITYGILNGFTKWDDISDANRCLAVFKACCSAALINLSKTPGPARSDPAMLSLAFSKFRPFVLRQIVALNPSIIICLGSMPYIGSDLGFQQEKCIKVGHAKASESGGRILVHAYHPTAIRYRRISQEKYCNDVIGAVARRLNRQAPVHNLRVPHQR